MSLENCSLLYRESLLARTERIEVLPNKQVEIEELFNRLFSADLGETTEDIINNWRKELADKRAEHTQLIAELSSRAAYRVARIARLDQGNGLMPRDRIAEVIKVLQSELPAFARANGIKIDELKACLNHKRKETQGANGARWQAYPLLFAETSEQGNREALASWQLETERETQYLTGRKKLGRMQYKPTVEPKMTVWESTNGRA